MGQSLYITPVWALAFKLAPITDDSSWTTEEMREFRHLPDLTSIVFYKNLEAVLYPLCIAMLQQTNWNCSDGLPHPGR